jgi:hypothetical protein
MPDTLYTLDQDGREVEADEMGNPLQKYKAPADALLEEVKQEAPEETDFSSVEIKEELPKDIDPECLVLETDTGWATFKPENIIEEEHSLVLVLDGKANGFIPRLSARFICHWKTQEGLPKSQNLYYAGVRFKLPQLVDKTLLVFLKTQ